MRTVSITMTVLTLLVASICGKNAFIGHPHAIVYGMLSVLFFAMTAYFGLVSLFICLGRWKEDNETPDYEDGQLDIEAGSIKLYGVKK